MTRIKNALRRSMPRENPPTGRSAGIITPSVPPARPAAPNARVPIAPTSAHACPTSRDTRGQGAVSNAPAAPMPKHASVRSNRFSVIVSLSVIVTYRTIPGSNILMVPAFLEHRQDSSQDHLRGWRAATNDQIDRHNRRHGPDDPITAREDSAIPGAVADGDHDLWIRGRIIGAPERAGHIACHRTRHQ